MAQRKNPEVPSNNVQESPPCGPDCPCQNERRNPSLYNTDEEWKPCLLVRSIQACCSNTGKVCGVTCHVLKHPRTSIMAMPEQTWRFIHALRTSPQGESIRKGVQCLMVTANNAVNKINPISPNFSQDHMLIAGVCCYPCKVVRRFFEAVNATINVLDAKYLKSQ